MAANEIIIYRGEYHQELFAITDVETGAPVDLTGAHVSLSAWGNLADSAPLFAPKTNDPGGGLVLGDQSTNPGQGVATFLPADTVTGPVERGLYVLWVTDAAGHPHVVRPPTPFIIREAKAP